MSEYSDKKNEEFSPVHTNKVGGSPYTGVIGWIDNRLPIFRIFKHEYLDFQVPKTLNYFWSFVGIFLFGFLASDPTRTPNRKDLESPQD